VSILDDVRRDQGALVAIRHDLHAHPELGLAEHRTAALVAEQLAAWGIEVHCGVGQTGVVGVLRNGNGQGAIGLRADMDALPIHEATGLAYASEHPGRMHACGHDGHTTMLLGAAKYLAETRNFSGTVNFIFQPAEEGIGGAQAMVDDGLFARFPCDFVYGMHNWPGVPVGQFQISEGPRFAGCSFFDIVITGKGAHGARPSAGIDPVVVACHVGSALQSIVSRTIAAQDTAVLSITRIQAGSAYNVIPETATLGGTVRTMARATMQHVERAMRRLSADIAAGFGATAELDFRMVYAPVINDPGEARLLGDAATDLVGAANVERAGPAAMVSEDFVIMMEQVSGAHMLLGNGESAELHHPHYDFNDEAIPYGVALYAAIAEKKLLPAFGSST
jgi:amidohydrolase